MIRPGDHVIVGLSGGMDSVCLLQILRLLQDHLDFQISAVHVNHGLRGAAADDDCRFVEELCRKTEIPLRIFRADVGKMAAERGRSIEETGRDFRYQCFRTVLKDIDADKIAVAHHQDDLCETVLLNLCRGTGISGLAGIPAVRDEVIRPLIDVSRKEIEAWIREKGFEYREDDSNMDVTYTRNRIRHEIMPALEMYINKAAGRHIAGLAADAAEVGAYIKAEARRFLEHFAENRGDRVIINIPELKLLPEIVQAEIVRQSIEQLSGSVRDISRSHLNAACGLADGRSGREIDLPYRLRASREYDQLVICKNNDQAEKTADDICTDVKWRVRMRVFPASEIEQIPKKRYTKWFDYDRMSQEPAFRSRGSDDYIVLKGGGRKKVRRVLMDAGVSREKRDRVRVFADGDHVIWIPAIDRISDDMKVTGETRHILEIQLEEITDERKS